jgi:4-hydroxy-tetrahydrodipicolinate reductase
VVAIIRTHRVAAMTRIGLYGAAGHMGTTLVRAITESAVCELAGGCERYDSPKVGEDLGTLAGLPPLGLRVTDDVAALCDASDVVVDYSAASATMSLIPVAIERRTPVLVCTTGFSETQRAALVDAGRSLPVMIGANMSVSVIAMYQLVKSAARMLGEGFDIEIFDFHPWDKIDSPSGTALELAEYAAEGRGVTLADVMVTARHGETAQPKRGRIGFSSARGG